MWGTVVLGTAVRALDLMDHAASDFRMNMRVAPEAVEFLPFVGAGKPGA
jgi:hypothetical protein